MPKANEKPKKKSSSKNQKPIKPTDKLDIKIKPRAVLPSVWQLSRTSFMVLWRFRWLFGGIILIYGVFNVVVVQGLSGGFNVASASGQVNSFFHGQYKQLSSGLTLYALLLASAGTNNTGVGGGYGYELIAVIMASLAIIWALRTTANQVKIRIRDAYYRGMFPLVPFFGIFLLIALELLPMIVGVFLYVTVINNSIAVTSVEKIAFGLLALALSALTIFWLSSSIFALYIVTLPEMTPFKALRSAKDLVRKRRWPIILRLLYLPVALLVVSAIVMLPVIIFFASLAQWVFLILSLIFLAIAHSYVYNFYRELLEQ
jgi:hypothetical protein